MSAGVPDVSFVIEAETDDPIHGIGLVDVVRACSRQTRSDRILECLVVSMRPPTSEQRAALDALPGRWLERPGVRYYDLKNEGIRESRGHFVALVDADTIPAEDWLDRALAALEKAGAETALVTGRTRYVPGPFSPELAIAQLPNQEDEPHDVDNFLAHNVLFRIEPVRQALFRGGHIRLGPDTDLAHRLIGSGYRLLYDPALAVTHNYARSAMEMWMHCVVIGYHQARFGHYAGHPGRGALRDAVGRFRVLSRRLRALRRTMGISRARVPLSLAFFAGYCVSVAVGFERGRRGLPEPFASF